MASVVTFHNVTESDHVINLLPPMLTDPAISASLVRVYGHGKYVEIGIRGGPSLVKEFNCSDTSQRK